MKEKIPYWGIFIRIVFLVALIPGSLIGLAIGVQGTIYLWKMMIEWGL